MSGVAFGVFLFLFLVVTVMGFAAARWRRAKSMANLDEWGLGGRGFGTFISWFLIGGDIYTAYTFIAVPATLFAGSVTGFFAVPYTIIIYPLIFVFLPRLWSVSHRHGYVTPADFVEGRYGSKGLGLAIALTGIVATMPYIALQLVGMQVVLDVMGLKPHSDNWFMKDLPLFIAFVILAAYTYSSGLGAGADRVRQGHADLPRHHRRGHLHPPPPRRLGSRFRRDQAELRRGQPEGGRGRRQADLGHLSIHGCQSVGLRLARPGLGAGAVHVPALDHRRPRR